MALDENIGNNPNTSRKIHPVRSLRMRRDCVHLCFRYGAMDAEAHARCSKGVAIESFYGRNN